MLKYFVVLLMGIILIFTWMNGVRASPIPITNAGFENPTLGNGNYTKNSIPGWSRWNDGPGGGGNNPNGNYGVFNPKTNHFTNQAPEGFNTAYSNGDDFYQILSDTLKPGIYTLTVKVGDRLEQPFPGYIVRLACNQAQDILAQDNNSLISIIPNGGFVTSTVTFAAAANNPLIGKPLVIALANPKGPNGQQVNFDDVQLDYTVHTPEPSTIILMGCGLIGLLGVVIKQRRKKSDSS